MHFRLKLFALHLLSSATVLTLILGSLYLGWYRWPGWYLTDVKTVVLVMICVDVVLGPTLTLIIANQNKLRRELTRDIGIIVAVQLCALTYGSASLWNGRPLYYAFSVNILQLVQAYDIDAKEAKLGREQNPALAPHWYSLPRWVWAPLPQNADEAKRIVTAAITGGDDVISMPRCCGPALRADLWFRVALERTAALLRLFCKYFAARASVRHRSQGGQAEPQAESRSRAPLV